jgi:dolichyl-phosphate-mannose--protein O-mannosyl transferase
MKALGDGPAGWRASGIFFATASILLAAMLARQVSREPAAPLLTAALLAFDPFHVHFGRTPMMESPVVFFFLAFACLLLEYTERGRATLPWAGLAMGLTVATKAYYLLAIPLAVAFAAWRSWRREPDRRAGLAVDFFASLVLLPAAVVLASHAVWFGRGFTLADLPVLQYDAWWSFGHDLKFGHDFYLKLGGQPWQWFWRPAGFGVTLADGGEVAHYLLEIHSPVFRWLVLPAMAWLAVRAWRGRDPILGVAPALFAATSLLFFLVGRQINSYSALAVYPFAAIAVADAVPALGARFGRGRAVTLGYLALVVVAGLVLFPLAAGLEVPKAPYAPLLDRMNLTGGR